MADEIKKVPEEVRENIENAQEGAISDDAAEAVAGGGPKGPDYTSTVSDPDKPRTGVVPGNTNRNRR